MGQAGTGLWLDHKAYPGSDEVDIKVVVAVTTLGGLHLGYPVAFLHGAVDRKDFEVLLERTVAAVADILK